MFGVWADSFKVISILPYKILTVTSPGYAMQVLSVTVYRQRNQGLEHLRSFISETQTLISFLSHSFQIPTLLCDQKKFYNIGHSVGNNVKKKKFQIYEEVAKVVQKVPCVFHPRFPQ